MIAESWKQKLSDKYRVIFITDTQRKKQKLSDKYQAIFIADTQGKNKVQ